jgi:acyl carrier protein
MNLPEVTNKLRQLVRDEYRIEVADGSADMVDGLGLDSLDITEMLFKVEEVFEINITTKELFACRSLDQVASLVVEKLATGQSET